MNLNADEIFGNLHLSFRNIQDKKRKIGLAGIINFFLKIHVVFFLGYQFKALESHIWSEFIIPGIGRIANDPGAAFRFNYDYLLFLEI